MPDACTAQCRRQVPERLVGSRVGLLGGRPAIIWSEMLYNQSRSNNDTLELLQMQTKCHTDVRVQYMIMPVLYALDTSFQAGTRLVLLDTGLAIEGGHDACKLLHAAAIACRLLKFCQQQHTGLSCLQRSRPASALGALQGSEDELIRWAQPPAALNTAACQSAGVFK